MTTPHAGGSSPQSHNPRPPGTDWSTSDDALAHRLDAWGGRAVRGTLPPPASLLRAVARTRSRRWLLRGACAGLAVVLVLAALGALLTQRSTMPAPVAPATGGAAPIGPNTPTDSSMHASDRVSTYDSLREIRSPEQTSVLDRLPAPPNR